MLARTCRLIGLPVRQFEFTSLRQRVTANPCADLPLQKRAQALEGDQGLEASLALSEA